jgi:hypothetical protein
LWLEAEAEEAGEAILLERVVVLEGLGLMQVTLPLPKPMP